METDAGLCQCGCGQKTNLDPRTFQPNRYLRNHHLFGKNNKKWKGGRKDRSRKYAMILVRNHAGGEKGQYIYEHIFMVEKAIGKALPRKCPVHHHNGKTGDNGKGNLVACEDTAYHHILHIRTRALRECGHANWKRCRFCGEYDAPENLTIPGRQTYSYHKKCNAIEQQKFRDKGKEEGVANV